MIGGGEQRQGATFGRDSGAAIFSGSDEDLERPGFTLGEMEGESPRSTRLCM